MAKKIAKVETVDNEVGSADTDIATKNQKHTIRNSFLCLCIAFGGATVLYHGVPYLYEYLHPSFTVQPVIQYLPPQPIGSLLLEEQPSDKPATDELILEEIVEPIVTKEAQPKISENSKQVQVEIIAQPEPLSVPVSFQEPLPQKKTKQTRPIYPVLDAIRLYNAFIEGEDCRPLLEELIKLPNKPPKMDETLMNVLQFCLNRPLPDQMQEAFNKSKKRAILRIFQNTYPAYLAYLKTIPYLLMDVRKKEPAGNTPMEILDQIADAIDTNHPHQVLVLIEKLPPNVQSILYDLKQYAAQEEQLYQSLDSLMQLLFQGDENE